MYSITPGTANARGVAVSVTILCCHWHCHGGVHRRGWLSGKTSSLLSLLRRFESGKAALLRLFNICFGTSWKHTEMWYSHSVLRIFPAGRASWQLPFISTTPSLGLYYNYRRFASSHTLHHISHPCGSPAKDWWTSIIRSAMISRIRLQKSGESTSMTRYQSTSYLLTASCLYRATWICHCFQVHQHVGTIF